MRAALATAFVLLCAALGAQAAAAERREQAIAQFPKGDLGDFTLQRKDFRFNNFSAWLKRDGTWRIEGTVSHRGLRCGTYEVGMRFGVGAPDCTDVRWVSEVRYVTSQSQCNEAMMEHSGTEVDPALGGNFDAISCGEAVIRCSGNCQ
jgi:hypothetical protein